MCDDLPYAEVTGERAGQADGQIESLTITGIDRKLTFSAKPPHRIEPGFRMLLAESERRGRRSKLSEASIPLTARPCMRYHFVAKHESMTQVEPWEVELRLVEPIPECLAAFPQLTPATSAASAPKSAP